MAFLPPNLKIMFNPRPAPTFLEPPPPSNLPPYSGLRDYLSAFTDQSNEEPFKREHIENIAEKREKKRKLKQEGNNEKTAKLLKAWDPYSNAEATGDPYKTVFVSRISYKTDQKKLEYEFTAFGPIKSIFLVKDQSNPERHRGYAFIEYEKERDMKAAYKNADGMKIDDKRIVVDIERGRVIKNWKPRKFGGGLGNTRAGGADVNQTFSGREMSEQREREKEREKEKEKEKERMEKMKKKDGAASSSNGSGRSGGDDKVSSSSSSGRSSDRDHRSSDRDRKDDRDGRSGRDDRDGRSSRDDRDRDRDRDHRSSRDDRERSSRDDRDRERSSRDDRDSRRDHRNDRDRDRDGRSGRDHRDDRSGRDHRSGGDREHRREDRDRRDYGAIDQHQPHLNFPDQNFQYPQQPQPQQPQQPQQPIQHHMGNPQTHPERINRDYSMISNGF